MGNRQDTSRRFDTFLTDNHRSIVQRTVLKENILNQTLVYIGIDNFSRTHHIIQRQIMFNDNQGTNLLLPHADTCHYHRHDVVMFQLLFLIAGEEAYQRTGMLMRAECQQEAPYLVLKQNDKRQHAHTDQLVEDGAEQFHLQHLRHHQPYQDKHQDTRKHIDRAGGFHQLIRIVQQESH